MRALGFVMAGALCFWTGAASAGPRMDSSLSAQPAPLVEVHHKPGHKGGPPWARRNQERNDWRESRSYDRSYSERRTACRTTYRTYFDDYTGDYVRRSVRVCD